MIIMKKSKTKHFAVFFLKLAGVPDKMGQKSFKPGKKKTISFKGKSFTLTHDKPTVRYGLKLFYFFDYDGTGQMLLNEASEKGLMTTEMMDAVVNEQIILQLVKANEVKKSIMDILIGLVMGLGVGLFIGSLIPGMIA
ncbi:hypothetical protein ES702_06945 [subsurface metagenome]